MFNRRMNDLGSTPPVVKNLIYINIVIFLATLVSRQYNIFNLTDILALHYPGSKLFTPVQLVTHMFMHSGIDHIFMNMFGLWMFGRMLEKVWGSKRFFIFYFVTGVGAALFYTLVNYIEYSHIQSVINNFANDPTAGHFQEIVNKYFMPTGSFKPIAPYIFDDQPFNPITAKAALNEMLNYIKETPMVGASGAIFGVLLAFGMLFPNTEVFFMFIPIPIKAKWLVIGYGAMELYSGFFQTGSNIAHFAHLGGMLFGFFLIKYWNTKRENFY